MRRDADYIASIFGGGGSGFIAIKVASILPEPARTIAISLSPAIGSLFAVAWLRLAPRIERWWQIRIWKREREQSTALLRSCIEQSKMEMKGATQDVDIQTLYATRIKQLELRLS